MNGPATYRIRVRPELSEDWSPRFDGLTLSTHDGETQIEGIFPDQSALHGLLNRIRDLGLVLISVRRHNPFEGDLR